MATTLIVPYQGMLGEMTESVPARGVNTETLTGTLDLGVRRGTLAGLHGETIAASTAAAARFGWRLGDRVRVTFGDAAPATLRLVALYARPLGFADLVVPRDLAARHMTDDLDREVFVAAAPGADAQALRDGLSADNPTVVVLDRASYLDRQESLAALDTQARYLLVGLLLAFAAVSAMNTIMMATRRRTAEFGMLRLIGVTRQEVTQMVTAEALITWAFAGAIGPTAAAIAAAGFAAGQAPSAVPAIPASWIAGLLAATALLTLSTGVLAAAVALLPETPAAAGAAEQ